MLSTAYIIAIYGNFVPNMYLVAWVQPLHLGAMWS